MYLVEFSIIFFLLQHVHCTILIHNHCSLSNKRLISSEGALRLPTTIPVTGVSNCLTGRADLILQASRVNCCLIAAENWLQTCSQSRRCIRRAELVGKHVQHCAKTRKNKVLYSKSIKHFTQIILALMALCYNSLDNSTQDHISVKHILGHCFADSPDSNFAVPCPAIQTFVTGESVPLSK